MHKFVRSQIFFYPFETSEVKQPWEGCFFQVMKRKENGWLKTRCYKSRPNGMIEGTIINFRNSDRFVLSQKIINTESTRFNGGTNECLRAAIAEVRKTGWLSQFGLAAAERMLTEAVMTTASGAWSMEQDKKIIALTEILNKRTQEVKDLQGKIEEYKKTTKSNTSFRRNDLEVQVPNHEDGWDMM